nr:hypothetical protein [Phycisphaerae bacterium]
MKSEQAIDDLSFIFDEEIEAQTQKEALSAAKYKELRKDYRDLFLGSAAGKRVLSDLLNACGVFETSFTGNSRTFYNEGRRE